MLNEGVSACAPEMSGSLQLMDMIAGMIRGYGCVEIVLGMGFLSVLSPPLLPD